MNRIRNTLFPFLCCLTLAATLTFAQTTGSVTGTVRDASGAPVPNVTVQVENTATGERRSATTDSTGSYRIDAVPVGHYRIFTSSSTSATSTPSQEFDVTLSGTQTVNLGTSNGPSTDAFAAQAVAPATSTNTAQTLGHFNTRYIQYLPQPNFISPAGVGYGAYNFTLLAPAVVATPYGPVVGGQRPSTNSFHIDGIDNNNLVRPGPLVYLSNEASQEFMLLQNPLTPEFGHTSGGKINTLTRSGSNQVHGALYWYLQNRNLNAVDQSYANAGIRDLPRFDQNRVGASVGAPIVPNRVFFFGNFEYIPSGFSNFFAGGPVLVPTQAGYSTLGALRGVSATNLGVLQQYAGAATDAIATTTINGTSIPLGFAANGQSGWRNQYVGTGALDFRATDKDQVNLRYVHNDSESNTSAAAFAPFQTPWNDRSLLASASWNHSFANLVTNQLRLGYTRYHQGYNLPNNSYPGLSQFPLISIGQQNLTLGPNFGATQNSIINTYHLADSVAFNFGPHELRVGFDGRRYLGRLQGFPSSLGTYAYSDLGRFLQDLPPDVTAQRAFNAGGIDPSSYSLFGYITDRWQVHHALTVELGVRYQWVSVPNFVKRQQDANAGLGVPGLLDFGRPESQTTNFAPRLGVAWSPGFSRPTVIRAGFGADYDALYSYLLNPLLTNQVGMLVNGNLNSNTPGFLANGGILNTTPANPTLAQQRAAVTSAFGAQKLPYSMQWNAAFQQTIWPNFTIELKYLGARDRHLPRYSYLNSTSAVTATNNLPLYLLRPAQSELNALPLTLTQLQAQSSNPLAQYGFTSPIATIDPSGNSDYHAGVVTLNHRFTGGVQLNADYTWSHLIDDVDQSYSYFSSSRQRGSSVFDRRHRVNATVFWELAPLFRSRGHLLAQAFTDFAIAGTYNYQSEAYLTATSTGNVDLTGYGLGSGAIYNQSGNSMTGSGVAPLTNSAGQTVAYLANNPNAQYFAGAPGMYVSGTRNTIPLGRINNFNVAAFKKFSIGEKFSFELRGDAYNLLNHPQYSFTELTQIGAVSRLSTPNFLNPASFAFANPSLFVPSNARTLQVGLRANF